MPTPEYRNAELRRILWALQDEMRAVDGLLKHGRENKIEPIRYASLTMMRDGLQNAIAFARQAVEQPEHAPS